MWWIAGGIIIANVLIVLFFKGAGGDPISPPRVEHAGKVGIRHNADTPRPEIESRPQGEVGHGA